MSRTHHPLDGGADKNIAQDSPSVRAHRNQVSIVVRRDLDDLLKRIARVYDAKGLLA